MRHGLPRLTRLLRINGAAQSLAPEPTKAQVLVAVRAGRLDPAGFAALAHFASGPLVCTVEDVELLLAYAQAVWIADQRKPNSTRACEAARRLVDLVPNLQDGHRLLGLAHLSRNEPREARAAFVAGRTAVGEQNLVNFWALSENLIRGSREASFTLDGRAYVLPLSIHNAAAIEAAAFHSVGMLTRIDELGSLESMAANKRAARVAEIGVLVGNHTAFFLQAFRPDFLIRVDADPANQPLMIRTVAANTPDHCRPAVEMLSAFVGRSGADTRSAGMTVAQRRLDQVVSGPIDLIKINVDGVEAELLQYGGTPIETHQPVVMIETTRQIDSFVCEWFLTRGHEAPVTFDRGNYRNLFFSPQRWAR